MRMTSLNWVHTLARRDERVVFVGSDLSPGLLDGMKAEFPGRHYMEGVAEANLIGMAAGLALEGYLPYVNTIATFLTRRCYEQVAVDVCLHRLPVRLIANGGGLVYAPLGSTHLAIEDIALLRALPGMTVVAPVDAEEMARLMPLTLDWPYPLYIRLGKGGDPVVSQADAGFAIGKGILMREAEGGRGAPVLLAATGVATTQALRAAEELAADGIACHVLHLHTVKPLDTESLTRLARGARLVVTVEEHVAAGGLGSAVLDALAETLDGALPRVRRIALPDAFPHDYGSQEHLMAFYGLDAAGIVQTVRTALAGK